MKTVFVVFASLLLLGLIGIVQPQLSVPFCPANPDTSVVPQARTLPTCEWYNSKSCCTVDDAQKIKSAYEGVGNVLGNFTIPDWIKGIFTPCLDQIHLLVCMPCDGNQTNYLNYNLVQQTVDFKICRSFCDTMYDRCGLAPISGPPNIQLIRSKYANGKAFCEGELASRFSFNLQVIDTNQQCFNTASTTFYVSTLTLLLLSLLFLL